MKIDFENMSIRKMREYIGKKVFIVHPGCSSDPYWGTIDSEPPHLLCKIINEICVSKLGIEIITGKNRYDSFNTSNYNMYFDEESAKLYLNKISQ